VTLSQKSLITVRTSFFCPWDVTLFVDEDLAGMYLTEKGRGKQRDVDQHDEVELLLEAYVKQVDGIVQEADQLASNMRNTEEIVNIILDANRNTLMLLDLKVPLPREDIIKGRYL
jgi:magnesium transporter